MATGRQWGETGGQAPRWKGAAGGVQGRVAGRQSGHVEREAGNLDPQGRGGVAGRQTTRSPSGWRWRGTLRGSGEGAALSGEQGEGGLERGGVPPCQELPKSWRIRTKPQRAAGDFGQWKSDCRKLGVPESKAADLRGVACQRGKRAAA